MAITGNLQQMMVLVGEGIRGLTGKTNWTYKVSCVSKQGPRRDCRGFIMSDSSPE